MIINVAIIISTTITLYIQITYYLLRYIKLQDKC